MLKGSGTIVMLLSSLLIQGTPGEGCCYPTISKGRKPNWTTATGTARPASAAASNCKNSTFMSLRVCVCNLLSVCMTLYVRVYVCVCIELCSFQQLIPSTFVVCQLSPLSRIQYSTRGIISTVLYAPCLPPSRPADQLPAPSEKAVHYAVQ